MTTLALQASYPQRFNLWVSAGSLSVRPPPATAFPPADSTPSGPTDAGRGLVAVA